MNYNYKDTRTKEQKFYDSAANLASIEGYRCKYELIETCKNDTERTNVLSVAEEYYKQAAFFIKLSHKGERLDINSYVPEIRPYLSDIKTLRFYKYECPGCNYTTVHQFRFYELECLDCCVNMHVIDILIIKGEEWEIRDKEYLIIDFRYKEV